MGKINKDIIFNKFNGLCAYTGKPLDDKWQVDHIKPQYLFNLGIIEGDKNDINNLIPAIKIINHYKRGNDLEQFRESMLTFHIRLSKLPKKTGVEKTKKRIIYMNTIAQLFGITESNPFNGVFYFETLNKKI